MTADFAAIEAVVAVVGGLAAGSGFALRVLHGPSLDPGRPWREALRPAVPVALAFATVVLLGGALAGRGAGAPFVEGTALGTGAGVAVVFLDRPSSADEGSEGDRPLRLDRATAGIAAAGTAVLLVLAVLLTLGVSPDGLFGAAVGPGLVLLLGEPRGRTDLRLRFAGMVAALAAATAMVPDSVVLRTVVPNALLLPLLLAGVAIGSAAGGLALDRIEGPYAAAFPLSALFGVGLAAVAFAAWYPGDAVLDLVAVAGGLAVVLAAYGPRWATFDGEEATETARAGVALGAIGSLARGLRSVALGVLGVAGAALIGAASVGALAPAPGFGVVLVAVLATTSATALGGVRAPAGPLGRPRLVPEELDIVAAGWAGLATALALAGVVPFQGSISSPALHAELSLGEAGPVAGLVLGAIAPFLLASAGEGAPRRTGALLVPALVSVVLSLLLGPSALIGFVLGASVTVLALGTFWGSARAAARSLIEAHGADPLVGRELRAAFGGDPGWRIAAAGIAAAVAALAVVAVGIPGTGVFGF